MNFIHELPTSFTVHTNHSHTGDGLYLHFIPLSFSMYYAAARIERHEKNLFFFSYKMYLFVHINPPAEVITPIEISTIYQC